MTTIYDVAEKAGVSPSTVSRVFSNSPRISEATKERVLQVAHELNYQPNLQASALTTKRTLLVGLVIPDILNPYAALVARGVQDYVMEQGYLSIICSTDGDPEKEMRLMREIHRRGVDGFIITPPHVRVSRQHNHYLESLLDEGVPMVFIGNRLDRQDVDFVTSRAQDGMVRAVHHLALLGHQRIALIGGRHSEGVAVGRWFGYQEALLDHGLPILRDYTLEADLNEASGAAAMARLLELATPPTAVVTANDLQAVGALRACQQRGVAVPAQMSLVGFDDIPLAQLTTPPLTTVAQPAYDLGSVAAELLLRRAQQPALAPQQITLPSKLVIRDSTAAPR